MQRGCRVSQGLAGQILVATVCVPKSRCCIDPTLLAAPCLLELCTDLVMNVFSLLLLDRPGVTDADAVERVQDIYTETLIEYVKKRRVDSSQFLAKLLMKLVDLRTVSTLHADCLYQLTVAKGTLPPLLREYYDIPHPIQPD